MLRDAGLVDRVMVMDKYLFDDATGFLHLRNVAGLARLGLSLRRERFDAALLLHHLITWPGVAKYAALMWATRSPLRLGLDDGRGGFLNRSAPDLGFGARHEVEYCLDVVGLVGAVNPDPRVRLHWSSEDDAWARERWDALGLGPNARVVAVHPGTGDYSPARRWAADRFAAVADALAEDGLIPMVVAGPGEEDLARQVLGMSSARGRLLAAVPTIHRLAAILSRCLLYVGNDSGVTHAAAAAGVPVVAIFGPSNHRAWAPYDPDGRRTRIVRLDLPCSP